MGRLMGIDHGIKRIGVALSDPLGITAQPFCVIERSSVKEDFVKIKDIIAVQEVSKIIFGLPLNMDGSEGPKSAEVRTFAGKLALEISIPIEFLDERLTTMQADRMLIEEGDVSREKRKGLRDKIAASLILECYMQTQNNLPPIE